MTHAIGSFRQEALPVFCVYHMTRCAIHYDRGQGGSNDKAFYHGQHDQDVTQYDGDASSA